ncbi:MAG: ornithine decarboxylase SpeF [Firmicutes bacterium]|nr:ornithine decarboxylase SpeF [Bacillota bacterium]
MKRLKIAYTEAAREYFSTEREIVSADCTDFTDVAAVVVTENDASYVEAAQETEFGLPVFVVLTEGTKLPEELMGKVNHVIDCRSEEAGYYSRQIEDAAAKYEDNVLPPFMRALSEYVYSGKSQFDCPGHQGGQFYRKHPAGRFLFDFYGENVFRSDLCNADVKLGDLLIHEGPAVDAEQFAAKVYNADKTYFVLNGTSASNKVVMNALLSPGDLILYDRNNHKSINHGACVQAGATPIYLETARNPFGFIGGIDSCCFDEKYLRELIAERAPEKADAERPFRVAVIQLGTYDGTIYNARQVIDKIGHLCDYILFDSAWVGYEQFIPMMKECSPLLLELGPNDPGIFVTQSVHKQQAGFSQTSQIHKKDSHIKGQDRYCNHKRVNNAFMMHASTSPFYPMFASLDVNAKMMEGEAGRKLWLETVKVAIEARKSMFKHCRMIRPFVPPFVDGKPWAEGDTVEMAHNIDYFRFVPGAKWHAFDGYGENQYFVDPCKFQLTTPGIHAETGEYESFGIPANILANYLRENGIIPEKCDLNAILFLMTPAETATKMENLVAQIARFEALIEADVPMQDVLPTIYFSNICKYKGYTIRQLCQEMHDFYKDRGVKDLQKNLFRKDYFPEYAMTPQEANIRFVRGEGELVALDAIEGRIALEGALPYPPGVVCVTQGEKWSDTAVKYFQALEEGINVLPGFAPEIQGVYLETVDGKRKAFGYVIKEGR